MYSYFASDGSYGDGDDIVVLDTDDWTDEMWNFISEEAGDYNRTYVAELFGEGATVEEVRGILAEDNKRIFLFAPLDLERYRSKA